MFPFLGSQLSSSIYHSLPLFLLLLTHLSVSSLHRFLPHFLSFPYLSLYPSFSLSFLPALVLCLLISISVPLNFLPAFCIVQYYILYRFFVSPSIFFSQLSLFFTLSIFLSFNVLSQSLLLSLFRPSFYLSLPSVLSFFLNDSFTQH